MQKSNKSNKTKKTEIKAVAFDIGGVLDSSNVFRDHYLPMCKYLNIPIDNFSKFREKYIGKVAKGEISTKKFFSLMAKEFNINSSTLLKNWIKFKRKSLKKDKKVEKIIKNLKRQGYIISSLTNIIKLHNNLRNEKNFYNLFDFNVISCNVGMRKPEKRIYNLLIKKLKLKPKEIIFIDDVKLCLTPAKKLGIKTIQFKNAKQLARDLKKFGIKLK